MSKFRYAAVPFGAIARFHELTPKAVVLYVHYCKWRNKETGLAWPSLNLIASTMQIPKATACRLRQQLAESSWLEIVEDDTVRLLVGFSQGEEDDQNGDGSVVKTTTERCRNYNGSVVKTTTERCRNYNGSVVKTTTERCRNYNDVLMKNHTIEPHYRTTLPTHPPRTTLEAPDGAGGGGGSTAPVYSLELCREYAQHLHDTGQGVTDPKGLAAAIYDGRLLARHRAALAAWLAARAQAAAQAAAAELAAARAAHRERYAPQYWETCLWPAAERLLSSDNALAHDLHRKLEEWDGLGQRADLACMKYIVAEQFFDTRPALGAPSFWGWDVRHNPQPFTAAAAHG